MAAFGAFISTSSSDPKFDELLPPVLPTNDTNVDAAAAADGQNMVRMYKTKSGLKYVDIEEGEGPLPRRGQLLTFRYSAYVKLPPEKGKPSRKQKYTEDTFLTMDGTKELIPGLSEGLHTMRVGGKRRLLIPPKLGFVSVGLGPIPCQWYERDQLNNLLDRMVELKGGELIYDIEMLQIIDNEADLGFWEDEQISVEDMEVMVQSALQEMAKRPNDLGGRMPGIQGDQPAPIADPDDVIFL
eukprot:CAMPEP_0116853102 /NCGR_PEP_ID=MMETSP0418-20121206/17700_1 /TAXON_ID=1158023 /ORGANISM="Astrosyne radiata, Strain 13vi08-1A" /LENGTH=240 /DNA_ID=CAMNT_0004485415 /DNA_START=35 /DNA_END=757 /DNA_ORIENTATION=-